MIGGAILLKGGLTEFAEHGGRVGQAVVTGRVRRGSREFPGAAQPKDAAVAQGPSGGNVQDPQGHGCVALVRAVHQHLGPVEESVLRIQAGTEWTCVVRSDVIAEGNAGMSAGSR